MQDELHEKRLTWAYSSHIQVWLFQEAQELGSYFRQATRSLFATRSNESSKVCGKAQEDAGQRHQPVKWCGLLKQVPTLLQARGRLELTRPLMVAAVVYGHPKWHRIDPQAS